VPLRGKAACDMYNGVLREFKVTREAGGGNSKMFCGVMMQMRTFHNFNSRKKYKERSGF